MKRILLLAVPILIATFSYGQSAKQMLAEIDGHWELDDNNNVSIVKVVEAPTLSADEIFNRALNYFTYSYGYGRSTIETQDKESGLIVGKGVFERIHVPVWGGGLDAWHVLRVDVKDGRARIIMTLTEFDQVIISDGIVTSSTITKVGDAYPVNPKGGSKTTFTKTFYKSYHKAFDIVEGMEKAIIEGNTSSKIENMDW